MTVIQHFLVRKHIAREVKHIHRRLACGKGFCIHRGQILVRCHCQYIGVRLGLTDIEFRYFGVGVRTTKDLSPHHAGQTKVGAVIGPAGYFIEPIGSYRPLPNMLKLSCFTHAFRPPALLMQRPLLP